MLHQTISYQWIIQKIYSGKYKLRFTLIYEGLKNPGEIQEQVNQKKALLIKEITKLFSFFIITTDAWGTSNEVPMNSREKQTNEQNFALI